MCFDGEAGRTRLEDGEPLMLNVAGRYVYLKPGRDPRFCISSISCCVLLPVFCMSRPDVENKALSAASFYMRPSSVSYRSPLRMSKAAILYNTGIPSPNAVMIPQGTGGQRGRPYKKPSPPLVRPPSLGWCPTPTSNRIVVVVVKKKKKKQGPNHQATPVQSAPIH